MRIDARNSGYASEDWPRLYAELDRAISATPMIEQLTMTDRLPLDFWNSGFRFRVLGVDLFGGDGFDFVQSASVAPDFFDVMGIPILTGRPFTEADGRASQRVAVVSQAAAERWWPDRPAVGQTLRISSAPDRDIRVVGVAGNAKVRSIAEDPRWYVYLPVDQVNSATIQFVGRGRIPASELVATMQRAALTVDPNLFVLEARTREEHVDFNLILPQATAWMFTLFAGLALILASVGLYGVVSFSVARRTREMGIRLALGAEGKEVVALVVKGGMILVAIGGTLGLLGALGAGRFLQRFLIGTSAWDPVVLGLVTVVLVAVSLFAACVPGVRASRVSPVDALKCD